MKFTILHTNDIHSYYENFARVATGIKGLKEETTLVLDAGDFADFKRLELQGTNGMAALELLDCAGYDAIAVGNNETFKGIETLCHMSQSSRMPFLSCNLYRSGLEPLEGLKGSAIIHKGGINFLVIGTSPELGEFYPLYNLEVKGFIEAIEDEIKMHCGAYDVCILLSHLGLDSDETIAHAVDGVDIIIGGHFHLLMEEPKLVNQTIIHTAGQFAEHLGLLKLEIDEHKSVKLLESDTILLQDVEQDPDILDILDRNKTIAIDQLSRPLYHIDRHLWHDVIEENPITNLLADALFDVFDCDLGMINSGIVNGGIKKGPVSDKKLLEICPSPLNPTCFEIQGKHLWEALKNSIDTDFCLQDGKGPGFRGRYLGRLHVSGAEIEYDGRQLLEVRIGDELLDHEKWYRVATSDYLHRGSGYTSLQHNRGVEYKVDYLRDTLREYAERADFRERAHVERWMLMEK